MNDAKRAAALAMSFLLAVGTISTTVFVQDTTADEQPDVAFDAERSGFNNETQRYESYFVINENTDAAEVDVEVGDYFIQMIDAHEAYLVPGDKFQADVYIENASRTYLRLPKRRALCEHTWILQRGRAEPVCRL